MKSKLALIPVLGVMVALGIAVPAFAQGDPVSAGFTSLQATALTYIAAGVTLIVAVLGAGFGVRYLVKWVKMAVKAS